MAIFKKRGKWWVDYYAKGKRYREPVGQSAKLAQEVLHKRKLEIAEEKFFPDRAREHLSFRQMAQIYFESFAVKRSKPIRYQQMIAHLDKVFGDKQLEAITPLMVEKYQVARQAEGVMTSTVNRETACLKAILYKAMDWGYYRPADGINPVKKVRRLAEPHYRTRFLSDDEIRQLLLKCKPRLYDFVVLALNTGMRLGELKGLRWENVDLENGVITLTKTKSGKKREVPINSAVRHLLETLPRIREFVLNLPNIDKDFPDAVRKAGLENCRFHDLRHTFASHLVMKGIDLYTVQHLLGHSTYEMTQRYAHLAPNQKRNAVEVLSSKWSALWTARPELKFDARPALPKTPNETKL